MFDNGYVSLLTKAPSLRRAATATIRRKLISIPASFATSGRQLRLHLPEHWPWETAWSALYDAILPACRRTDLITTSRPDDQEPQWKSRTDRRTPLAQKRSPTLQTKSDAPTPPIGGSRLSDPARRCRRRRAPMARRPVSNATESDAPPLSIPVKWRPVAPLGAPEVR